MAPAPTAHAGVAESPSGRAKQGSPSQLSGSPATSIQVGAASTRPELHVAGAWQAGDTHSGLRSHGALSSRSPKTAWWPCELHRAAGSTCRLAGGLEAAAHVAMLRRVLPPAVPRIALLYSWRSGGRAVAGPQAPGRVSEPLSTCTAGSGQGKWVASWDDVLLVHVTQVSVVACEGNGTTTAG